VAAISETVAVFNVVACPAAPVAHFTVVFAPSMQGMIANGHLSVTFSFALKVGGLVHVAVDAMTDTGYGVGGRESV